MKHQAELFEQMKPELLTQYLNQYLWFENGQVLDFDIGHEAFVLRVYGDGEPRPRTILMVRKVVSEEPTFLLRSPLRLV